MIGFGRHGPDQILQVVVGGGQYGVVVVGSDTEDESFAAGVQQVQIAKRCGDLVSDDDLVEGFGDGEGSAAQVEWRVLPVADNAGVVADTALPSDRR